MKNQLNRLEGGYQPDDTWEDPEEPPYNSDGKDPLDRSVDDEHWYDDED